jgi:hypothetical protein
MDYMTQASKFISENLNHTIIGYDGASIITTIEKYDLNSPSLIPLFTNTSDFNLPEE